MKHYESQSEHHTVFELYNLYTTAIHIHIAIVAYSLLSRDLGFVEDYYTIVTKFRYVVKTQVLTTHTIKKWAVG